MDHLAALDSAFLALEDDHAALTIGSVAVFDGPAPTTADFRRLYAHKLHLVPRLRQRLQAVPLALGRAAWVDDTTFDLTYHLRRTALPSPGNQDQLEELVGRLISIRLDRDRPLWKAWLVDNVGEHGWAIVTKVHHSMLDGVGGLTLLGRILDRDPDAALPRQTRWEPRPAPSRVALATSATRAQVRDWRAGIATLMAAVGRPRATARELGEFASGIAAYRVGLRRTSDSSLAGELHAPRRYRALSVELSAVDTVRQCLGGTVNDVLLALVTGALREVLRGRNEKPALHQVHCLVPVSTRRATDVDDRDPGNRVSALIVDLPVEFGDPLVRYRAVLTRTQRTKATHEADAGDTLETMLNASLAPFLTAGLRVLSRLPQRFLTTVVTNVPGPHAPMYALGRPMTAHYPIVPIADRLRIGIAATSYLDRLYLGITADRDAVRDVDAFAAALLLELETLVGAHPTKRPTR